MRPERDYLDLPIHSLQEMLRQISFQYPALPRLTPDGVFGEKTLEAVMVFQREQGLPVTGRVDNETWDAVVTVFRTARPLNAPPRPLSGWPGRGFQVRAGQCCAHMLLVQAMFQALSLVLDELESAPATGSHTGPSVRNVVRFQRMAGLPETGTVDILTWNALCGAYALFVVRGDQEGLCPGERPPAPGRSPAVRGFPWEPYDAGRFCRE